MPAGQLVKKFTWLLDNVEVKGIVRSIEADSFAIEPDANYGYLIALMSGNNPLPWASTSTPGRIHCETYPLGDPTVGEINRAEPWFLPRKNDDVPFAVRHPATGW